MISITIESAEMNKFFNQMKKFSEKKQAEIKKEVARTTYAIEGEAKLNAPVDRGLLRNRITSTIRNNEITGRVEVKSNYGVFVHEGTKPHLIQPRNKKILAWSPRKFSAKGRKIKTNIIFAKLVNHPGTKANPFLRKAVDKENKTYINNLTKILSEA
jgi:HK97 gp10 family phage protein